MTRADRSGEARRWTTDPPPAVRVLAQPPAQPDGRGALHAARGRRGDRGRHEPRRADARLGDLLDWADVVFVMERRHARVLRRRFGRRLDGVELVVPVALGIPDRYDAMDAELIALLEHRCARHLPGDGPPRAS